METSRREALALAGAAAGMAMAGAGGAFARDLGSAKKTLFWTAAVTPCDKNLKFDPGAMRDIVAYLKEKGTDGIVVLGTTGEFPSFSVAERKLIAETVLADKKGLNIIVNPGTPNFPETLELSRHAQDHGADGLLVIPPFYYDNPPTEGLIRYYSMLFEQVSIPINLYHIPGTSQVPISHELLRAMMKYPNLAGIKDSTGDPKGYASFVADFPELNMRSGTGNNLAYALDHGMGAILAEGNVFTAECAAVFKTYRAGGDYHAAAQRMADAIKVMRSGGIWGYGPMKYALSKQMGGPQTYQRPPNADVTDAQKLAINSALDQIKGMA
ncbi:MAG: dihydrodipicolinate synthase family protein [Caulobacteraceae bacterium]|nr:dihydrodipicolinate synthase family protein [Caulobacteraceae bacterium]